MLRIGNKTFAIDRRYPNASITRSIAGCCRFFTLTQCLDSASLIRPIPVRRCFNVREAGYFSCEGYFRRKRAD